jgi:DNA-binding NarL/FixJ family response regulator
VSTAPIRVLIVDDHLLFSDVIRGVLQELGMDVVATASRAAEGIELVRRHRPQLVLVDLGLPDESGLSLGRKILDIAPDTKVVAVTSLLDPKAVSEALRLGFQGYVTKDLSMRRFTTSLQAVLDGQVVLPRRLVREDAGALSDEDRQARLLIAQLTPRERDVLVLLTEGVGGQELARRLHITPNTVRTHIQNVLTKLHVHSRFEAAAFATRHGLVPNRRRPT